MHSFINFFLSTEANNFGTLLSGIGTVLLALLGVYAAISLSLWKKQKRQEVLYERALQLLNRVDCFEIEIKDWLKYIWFVSKQFTEKPTPEELQNSPLSLVNYSKKHSTLIIDLAYIKTYGRWVDEEIVDLISSIEKLLTDVMYSLTISLFVNATKEQKIEAHEVLSSINIANIEKSLNTIREKLKPHILFEQ